MKKNAAKLRAVSLLLFLSSIISFNGCSIWENFTTYFNLYYNASDKFEAAEQLINEQKKINIFEVDEAKIPANANQNLTVVIEKLSKLLQFYNKSSFVDDALLMIGKSFYYQQDYIKAYRKFNELITTFPESELVFEAMLWSGKTLMRQNKFEEGIQTLVLVREKAVEAGENEIVIETYIQQIAYLIEQENYSEAVTNINELIKVSEDEEKNAAFMYELGQLYLENNELENAAKAFANVMEYSPDFETEFKARIEYGKLQRELGKVEEALAIFEDLKGESNFNDFLNQTDLEIGITLVKLKRLDEGFEQLTYVDSSYKQTPSSGLASFNLGLLMEKEYKDFDSANVYFVKASSSSAPPEYIELARKKTQVLKKYQDLSNSISKFNKQLFYIANPDSFKKDSAEFAQKVAIEDSLNKIEQEKKQEEQELTNTEGEGNRNRRTGDRPVQQQTIEQTIPRKNAPENPVITADSVKSLIVKNEYELAGLFFTELDVIDSAYFYYSHLLSEYPENAYTAKTLYALGTYYLTIEQKERADSLFNVVYENYKNEEIVNAAADKINKPLINFKFDPAEELYIAAEGKLKAEQFNEAVTDFYTIAEQYPKSNFAPKALFASGWILENKLKLLDSAAVVYDSVVSKYSKTQYARVVSPKLDLYKAEIEKKNKAIEDSLNALKKKDIKGSDSTAVQDDSLNADEQLPGISSDQEKSDSIDVNPNPAASDSTTQDPAQEEFTPDVPPPVMDDADKIDSTGKIITPPDSLKKQ